MRLNRKGLNRLKDDLQLYWEEKARLACHKNTISIYNLVKLYEVPIEEVPRLAEAKYGVRQFCPDHGTYSFDARKDQVRLLRPRQQAGVTAERPARQEVIVRRIPRQH